jgi:proteasome lid subunit RPN8/RPN11
VSLTDQLVREILKIVCSGLGSTPSGGHLEVSGLLLGRYSDDKIIMTRAVTGKQASSEISSELDQNFIASVAHSIVSNGSGEFIVGMFHSHPEVGIFISQQDAKTMVNFQKLFPQFVMMVVDPIQDTRYKFFRYDFATTRVVEVPHIIERMTQMESARRR